MVRTGLRRPPDRLLGRGELLGLPVSVDVRERGLGPALRDGFAWLRDVDQRFTHPHPARCGVVAGEAVQSFAEWLRAEGAQNFRIDVGGDVITAGAPEPGAHRRVGIRHPWRVDRMCAVLSLSDHAIATATRTDHPDPGRGRLVSVTVIAADLAAAGATAAMALALGRDGIAWVGAQPGCLVFAVTDDGFQQYSTDLRALIEHG